MEDLERIPEELTPSVLLSKDKGIFNIKGRSINEYPEEFYNPIIEWVENYADNPNENTVIEFNLEYFNTPSAPYIKKVIEQLQKVRSQGKNLEVKWFYEVDDEDMLEIGNNFANILQMEFTFIETY